jgi:hypothetical protein
MNALRRGNFDALKEKVVTIYGRDFVACFVRYLELRLELFGLESREILRFICWFWLSCS